MSTNIKTLRVVFWLPLLAAAVIALLYETDVLPAGVLGGSESEYGVMTIAELATVILLPSAAFLHRWKPVARHIEEHGAKAAVGWWLTRLVMVGIPLIGNTLLYYLYMSVSAAYMAMMSAVIMVFIYPKKKSDEGRKDDTHSANESDA